MEVGDLLFNRQKSLFVGREKELEAISLTLSNPEWKLLNLYGPSGIGKTTLLKLFTQVAAPNCCFYFDGHQSFQTPNDFSAKLRSFLDSTTEDMAEITALLNSYAAERQGLILLFDTFEQWTAIEKWLRDEWFPKLSPFVKICLAGRYALAGAWLRNGWNLHIDNKQLLPLSLSEIHSYAKAWGIVDKDIIVSLQRFSNGLPLALSMACEIIVRKGNTSFLDQRQQKQIIGHLVSELTKDIDDIHLKTYTEAASMVWRFDQELLQSLIQTSITNESFREFCRLPYVIRLDDNWTLHDSVRQWTFTDFRSRMPQTFYNYRNLALKELNKREFAYPHLKTDVAFEKLYLHELDFVREFRFQWDDSLRFGECREQDLAQVEELYIQYLRNQSNYIAGEAHLEQLIQPLWEIDPSSFIGLWQDEQLIAFCSCIPLTEQTVQIFRTNAITTPITSQFESGHQQSLICIAGVDVQLESEINGSVARAMAKIIDRNVVILDLISMPYWSNYLPLLGFVRASWGDSATPKGVQYMGYQLDLRSEDFASKLHRMLSTMEPSFSLELNIAPNQLEAKLSLDDAVKLVQRALKHFHKLPINKEMAHNMLPLLQLQEVQEIGKEPDKIAQLLQEKIRTILLAFSSGNKEQQRYYRILHYAYIQKIGTHEIVAEYLNIPSPSYFRYLKSAIRTLAYELINSD